MNISAMAHQQTNSTTVELYSNKGTINRSAVDLFLIIGFQDNFLASCFVGAKRRCLLVYSISLSLHPLANNVNRDFCKSAYWAAPQSL